MSTSIYSIYKATNTINGKCYIGFDSNWPFRLNNHKKTPNKTKFHNAIRKHGWESFEWEILYQSMDGHHCLKEMESYFIREYNSFNNGYNMTLGGEGTIGYKHTTETKKKISKFGSENPFYGKHHSNETKKILKEKSKTNFKGKQHTLKYKEMMKNNQTGSNNSFYGKHHNDNTKNHLSEKMKEYWIKRKNMY